jgi:hypothetical protein
MSLPRYTAIAAISLCALASPAAADEVEDALKYALEAYQAGDLDGAKEELDFASQLIAQMKAAGLSDFLPDPMEGWTRRDKENAGQAMGFMGGGSMAEATYVKDKESVEIQLMANNQMVNAMAGLFGNPAMMGAQGTVKRIGRQKVLVNQNGELQALIDGRIFVQISGRAPVEIKEAYFEAIDFDSLKDF